MAQAHETSLPKKSHKHDGVQPHILTYIASIVLTGLAFAAVIYGGLDVTFVFLLITVLAIIQALFQMVFWMHMKDKGHAIPIIFMIGGAAVIFPVFVTLLLWTWGR